MRGQGEQGDVVGGRGVEAVDERCEVGDEVTGGFGGAIGEELNQAVLAEGLSVGAGVGESVGVAKKLCGRVVGARGGDEVGFCQRPPQLTAGERYSRTPPGTGRWSPAAPVSARSSRAGW